MKYIKLGDVIESAKCRRSGEDEYPVLSITKSDGIVLQSEKFKKRIASQDTSQYKVVCRGQLVQGIHIDEANFGIQDIVDEGIVSPAYKIWNVNTGIIDGKYLAEVLRSPRSIQYYSSNFNGSVKRRERLSDKDFLAMDIPCPSLTEQKHVLDVIDKSREVIAYRHQELQKLDELIKARFVEVFSDKERKYPMKKMAAVCSEIIAGGDRPKETSEQQSDKYKYPVFANAASNAGFLCYAKSYRIESPSVTVSARGSTVGFTAVRSGKYTPVVRLIALVPGNKILPVYLKQYLDINHCVVSTGSAQPQVTIPYVKDIDIIVPPLQKQKDFEEFCKQVDKSKVAVQAALDKAQLLFDSLIQEYFG